MLSSRFCEVFLEARAATFLSTNATEKIRNLSLLSLAERTYKNMCMSPTASRLLLSACGLDFRKVWFRLTYGKIFCTFRNRPVGIVVHTVFPSKLIWGYFVAIFPRGKTAAA
jgi:hypothetical protein